MHPFLLFQGRTLAFAALFFLGLSLSKPEISHALWLTDSTPQPHDRVELTTSWPNAMDPSLNRIPEDATTRDTLLNRFFGTLEGTWQGRGTLRTLFHRNGRTYWEEEPMRIRMKTQVEIRQPLWTMNVITELSRGRQYFEDIFYQVSDGSLLVNTSPWGSEPVRLLNVFEDLLTYRFFHRDAYSGQIYETTISLEFEEGGRTLYGTRSTRTNGRVVQEVDFQAQRRR
jgi:hypothetical protein